MLLSKLKQELKVPVMKFLLEILGVPKYLLLLAVIKMILMIFRTIIQSTIFDIALVDFY